MNRIILATKVAVSAVIALGLVCWLGMQIESHPRYTQAENDILIISDALAMKSLNAGLPTPSDISADLDRSISRPDPWGNPYQYAEDTNAASRYRNFRIHSMGKDGQSSSGGNDPDDINSWDSHHREFYDRIPLWRVLIVFILIQLFIGVPVFGAVHCLHLVVRALCRRAVESKGP